MSWQNILGNEKAKKILQRSVLEGRIAGTYLFWGGDGFGKDACALELAKTANCCAPIVEGDKIDACGQCSSCRKFANLASSNLALLFATPSAKSSESKGDSLMSGMSDEQALQIRELISEKARNPYFKIRVPKANNIGVGSIRELKRLLSLTASGKGRRFAIIFDAHEMTVEAANAFLKTLEEPNPDVTIILTTSRPESLPSTILSRSQQIRFNPIPAAEIEQKLLESGVADAAEAKMTATFSRGSYSAALDFLNEDLQSHRRSIIEFLRTVSKKNYRSELAERIQTLLKENEKSTIETFLALFIFWMRDVAAVVKSDGDASVYNLDEEDNIRKFAAFATGANLDAALVAIERSIIRLRRNVAPQLTLFALFIQLRKIFLEKTV